MTEYEDIRFETDPDCQAAIITINRPERYNAFRSQTVDELVDAFRRRSDRRIRPVPLIVAVRRGSLTGYQTAGRLRPCRSMRKSLT